MMMVKLQGNAELYTSDDYYTLTASYRIIFRYCCCKAMPTIIH